MTYHAKVIAGGKMVLPAELRRELGLQIGDSVVIERQNGKLILKSYAQMVKEVQAEMRELVPDHAGIVEEFLAEKRTEAAREEERDRAF